MRYPSVETILAAFRNLDRYAAQQIRAAMATRSLNQAMDIINETLGTYGVEFIRAGSGKRPSILYCNAGDPYVTTILYVNGKFRVGCWGDLVEKGNYA